MKTQTILLHQIVGRYRRHHIVDPFFVDADRFEFRS